MSTTPCGSELGQRHQKAARLRADMEAPGAPGQAVQGEGAPAPEPQDAQPVGQGEHVVKEGECVSSIAMDTGHFWQTIWEDSGNREVRQVRRDPNVLLPGDRLVIPEKRRKDETGQTEQRHRFVRRGSPEILQVRFEDEEKAPYMNQPYTIQIDGVSRDGWTDGDGAVRESIPPNARSVKIRFTELDEEYEFGLGRLEPIESLKGVQAGLRNLGFLRGSATGKLDPPTVAAIRRYQKTHDLAIQTGELYDATRQHILEAHMS